MHSSGELLPAHLGLLWAARGVIKACHIVRIGGHAVVEPETNKVYGRE